MTGAVGGFFERCGLRAASQGRYFTGYELGQHALKGLMRCKGPTEKASATALELLATLEISKLRWDGPRDALSNALFDIEAARRECEGVLARTQFRGRVTSAVLYWMSVTQTEDKSESFIAVRRAIQAVGLTPETLTRIESERKTAREAGSEIDAEGEIIDETDLSGPRFAGRQAQMVQHESQLRQALLRREHYLLTSTRGSGRTTFARRLAETMLRNQSAHPDPRLEGLHFMYFDRRDLLGSAQETRERFDALARAVSEGATAIIDDIEILLSPRLPASEEAIRAIGHELIAAKRSFILIAEEEQARQIGYLSHLDPSRLPALGHATSMQVASEAIEAAIERNPTLSLGEDAGSVASEIVRLRRSNYTDASSPAGEIKLVGGTAEMVRRSAREPRVLNSDAVRTFVARDRDLPKAILERDGPELLAMIREELSREVVGQSSAVDTVARAIAFGERTSTGTRPRARLLLMGPPGVGKTHLATELANVLGYGHDGFIRLNMSEYSGEAARTRFLGADPGYVGFRTTRALPDQVRARPSSVILLDEIDRAHASIQDLLLAILEGECADASGKRVSFAQTVILATTNLGQEQIESRWHEGRAKRETREEIARSLDDVTLRELVQRGAVDETEKRMQEHADARIAELRGEFEAQTDPGMRDAAIDAYLNARARRQALALQRRHGSLDRAFLDRIDFAVAFLPISSPEVIAAIVDKELRKARWHDCPQDVRETIIGEVLRGGSVRTVDRLILKHFIDGKLGETERIANR